jgi:hypothetical protein
VKVKLDENLGARPMDRWVRAAVLSLVQARLMPPPKDIELRAAR